MNITELTTRTELLRAREDLYRCRWSPVVGAFVHHIEARLHALNTSPLVGL